MDPESKCFQARQGGAPREPLPFSLHTRLELQTAKKHQDVVPKLGGTWSQLGIFSTAATCGLDVRSHQNPPGDSKVQQSLGDTMICSPAWHFPIDSL